MNVLVDTSVLARMAEPGHIQHSPALDSTDRLGKQGHSLFVVPQVFYEFWVVCTRPTSVNGLGKSAAAAAADLATFKTLFGLLDDTPAILPEWGKPRHDLWRHRQERPRRLTRGGDAG
jgi:hypothetical protein